MWKLVKRLPWRGILLAVLIIVFLAGLYATGYNSGHDDAGRDGSAALSRLQSEFDTYKTEQITRENAALRAWAARYQAQVTAGFEAGQNYLEQIASLERQNQKLQGEINDVTQRWMDEKGKSHPINCVFTRGFVRQYNAALGYEDPAVDTGHAGSGSSVVTVTGAASRQPDAADARLRNSGVSQQDVLANVIDNAKQCRVWRGQINSLLDEREGLLK